MITRFLRDSALYGVANLLGRGMTFFLLPVYTAALSKEEVGAFEWTATGILILLALLPLEITQSLARLRSKDMSDEALQRHASTAFTFTVITLSTFAATFAFLADSLKVVPLTLMPPLVLTAASILLLVNGWLYFVQNELRWSGRAEIYAVTSIITASVTAVTALLTLLVLDIGILGLYAAMILGSGSGAVIATFKLRYLIRPRLDRTELMSLLRFSYPLAISSVAIIFATTVDRLLVAQYLNLESLGQYGVALRLAAIATVAFQGFQLAALPVAVQYAEMGDWKIRLEQAFRIYLLIAISVALLLSALSPGLVSLLAGPNYETAQIYIPILLVGTVANSVYPFAPGLWLTGRSRAMASLGIILALVGLGASILLIPRVGLLGAAISYSVTGLVYAGLILWASDRVLPIDRRRLYLGWALALLLLGVVGQIWAAIHHSGVVVRIAMCLLVILILVRSLLTTSERHNLLRRVGQLLFLR